MKKRMLIRSCFLILPMFLFIISAVPVSACYEQTQKQNVDTVAAPYANMDKADLTSAGDKEHNADIRSADMGTEEDFGGMTGLYSVEINLKHFTGTHHDFRYEIKINSQPYFNGSKYKRNTPV